MSNATKWRRIALALQAFGLFFFALFHLLKHRKLAYTVSLLAGASGLLSLRRARQEELLDLEALYQEPQSFDCDENTPWEEGAQVPLDDTASESDFSQ